MLPIFNKINDSDQPLLIVNGKFTYQQDGLYSLHNADFLKEPKFKEAYAKGKATNSWKGDPAWRTYIACWLASQAIKLEGEFVECGVNKGGMPMTIMNYTPFKESGKTFYLLDTYGDLVDEQISESERELGIKKGSYEQDYLEEVKNTFANYPVKIIRGMVPQTLSEIDAEKISFLSIDMNVAKPEIEAIEYLWPRLSKGAFILLDDYGWEKHFHQKQEHDKLASKLGYEILSLPTGQGLIMKS